MHAQGQNYTLSMMTVLFVKSMYALQSSMEALFEKKGDQKALKSECLMVSSMSVDT